MKFTLRPARESDLSKIKDLIHLVGINPMSLDWKRFIVAVDQNDQMVGCGQLKPHGKEILELASIAVFPQYQKNGIARRMIERLLQIDHRPLFLTCQSSLETFYNKFGFISISREEMPRYYQRLSKIAEAVLKFANRNSRLLVMKLQ